MEWTIYIYIFKKRRSIKHFYDVVGETVGSWSIESVSRLRFAGSFSFSSVAAVVAAAVVSSSSSGKNLICSRGANVSESGG